MSTITEPSTSTVEGVVGTDKGNQRVVMTNAFTGTQLVHSTKSVEVLCDDGSGNKQLCVAVTHFSDSESSSIPSQLGHGGQFLKTNGTTIEWDDALQNEATGSLGFGVGGATVSGSGAIGIGAGVESNGASSVAIGTASIAEGDDSICIGTVSKDNNTNSNVCIGSRTSSTQNGSVVVGYNAKSTAIGGIAIGLDAEASEAGTFNVGLSTDGYSGTSYKVLENNGQICASRFATIPVTNGNYRLRATVNNGVVTYSWVAE